MADGFHLLDADVLARLKTQPLLSRLPMEGNVSGHHKSPHRGSSVEFAEYRNYTPGDDIRRLDWRVYARTDRFYLKEFEAETNLRCHFVLDASASMGFEGKGRRKMDVAVRVAANLAHLIVNQGDAAGLTLARDANPLDVPAKRNPSHLSLLLSSLNDCDSGGDTVLPDALHELAETAPRRGLIVILSDLFCDPSDFLDALQHLRFRKHDIAVFHLLDPEEVAFEFDRPIRFLDMESPFNLVTEPALIRDAYLKEIHDHLDRIKSGCMEHNIDYRRVMTDIPYDKALTAFLLDRARQFGVV